MDVVEQRRRAIIEAFRAKRKDPSADQRERRVGQSGGIDQVLRDQIRAACFRQGLSRTAGVLAVGHSGIRRRQRRPIRPTAARRKHATRPRQYWNKLRGPANTISDQVLRAAQDAGMDVMWETTGSADKGKNANAPPPLRWMVDNYIGPAKANGYTVVLVMPLVDTYLMSGRCMARKQAANCDLAYLTKVEETAVVEQLPVRRRRMSPCDCVRQQLELAPAAGLLRFGQEGMYVAPSAIERYYQHQCQGSDALRLRTRVWCTSTSGRATRSREYQKALLGENDTQGRAERRVRADAVQQCGPNAHPPDAQAARRQDHRCLREATRGRRVGGEVELGRIASPRPQLLQDRHANADVLGVREPLVERPAVER